MDDLLIFADQRRFLWQLEGDLAEYLRRHKRLELKRRVSEVYRYTVGVPFLGLSIFRGTIRLSAQAKRRFIRKMRRAELELLSRAIDETTYQRRIAGLLGYANAAGTTQLRRAVLHGDA